MRAYDYGYDAYAEGVSKYENPYEPGEIAFTDWNAGWETSKEDRSEYLDGISPLRPEDYDY